MQRRQAIAVLGLLLAGLQYRLWIADGGVVATRRLQQAVAREAQAIDGLRQRNAVQAAEVADLKSGGSAIEAHARSELGMIRRGETFYLVVVPPPAR